MRRLGTALTTALLGLVLAASPAAAAYWTEPTPYWGGYSESAVTFDAGGHLHAAIAPTKIAGPYGILYVTDHTSEWVLRRGDMTPFYPETSIAYSAGKVRIVWVDSDHRGALWLSRNDTGTWVSSRLWLGVAHDPVVANLGRGVGVAFRDSARRLRYLTWDPVKGPSVPVVVATHCCDGFSLAVAGGQPAIAYASQNSGAFYAARTTGGWHSSPICGAPCGQPSLAFRNSVPAIVYVSGDDIWYVYRTAKA